MLIKESLSTTMHCTLVFVYIYGNCAIKYDNYSCDVTSTALPAITALLESLQGWIQQGFSRGCWVSSQVFLYNSLGGGGRAFKWLAS
jgi:hypothetical protein